jgi:hypothetical protein
MGLALVIDFDVDDVGAATDGAVFDIFLGLAGRKVDRYDDFLAAGVANVSGLGLHNGFARRSNDLSRLILGGVGMKLKGFGANDLLGGSAMASPMSAAAVLEREFLPLRAKLIEIGAILDRMDRSDGSVEGDARRRKVDRALDILQSGESDRAEQLQMLFSLPYEEHWREPFNLSDPHSPASSL